jgi:hypothetical protein
MRSQYRCRRGSGALGDAVPYRLIFHQRSLESRVGSEALCGAMLGGA